MAHARGGKPRGSSNWRAPYRVDVVRTHLRPRRRRCRTGARRIRARRRVGHLGSRIGCLGATLWTYRLPLHRAYRVMHLPKWGDRVRVLAIVGLARIDRRRWVDRRPWIRICGHFRDRRRAVDGWLGSTRRSHRREHVRTNHRWRTRGRGVRVDRELFARWLAAESSSGNSGASATWRERRGADSWWLECNPRSRGLEFRSPGTLSRGPSRLPGLCRYCDRARHHSRGDPTPRRRDFIRTS